MNPDLHMRLDGVERVHADVLHHTSLGFQRTISFRVVAVSGLGSVTTKIPKEVIWLFTGRLQVY